MVSQKTMKAPKSLFKTVAVVEEARKSLDMLYEEFARFRVAMEELHFLKLVARDLKSFRRMLRFKRFD